MAQFVVSGTPYLTAFELPDPDLPVHTTTSGSVLAEGSAILDSNTSISTRRLRTMLDADC